MITVSKKLLIGIIVAVVVALIATVCFVVSYVNTAVDGMNNDKEKTTIVEEEPTIYLDNKKEKCLENQAVIKTQVESWCKDNFFNIDFTYSIASDGEKAWIANGDFSEDKIHLITDDVHDGAIPACPSCGTVTVKIESKANGVPEVVVTCEGGENDYLHK